MPCHPTSPRVPDARTPNFVITPEGELHGEDTPQNHETARRIRACVNACESFATEDLEAGILTQMLSIIREVQPLLDARRDEDADTTLRVAG